MTHKRRLQAGVAITVILGILVGVVLVLVGVFVLADPKFSPPLLQGIDFNLGKTVTMIGVVLVLFPAINALYVKPVKQAIDERNGELIKTFTEAEELRAEMTKMRADYEKRLAETEADARAQIQAQIKEAQQLRQTLMSEAAAKADELLKKANQEIEAEKVRVIGELRLEVVNLTLAATEKLLGENIDPVKNRRLVEEFIDKIEVKA